MNLLNFTADIVPSDLLTELPYRISDYHDDNRITDPGLPETNRYKLVLIWASEGRINLKVLYFKQALILS